MLQDALNQLLSYDSLHEQAILLSYRVEEGDIPESPLWVAGLKKKKSIINRVENKNLGTLET